MKKDKEEDIVTLELHCYTDENGKQFVNLESVKNVLEYALGKGRTKADTIYAIEIFYEGVKEKLNEK